MSYSFNVKAATKVEAINKVREELARVVAAQSVHSADCDQAQGAAEAMIELLADDDAQNVDVSVNGSIWQNEHGIQQVSVKVDASLQPR